MTDAAKKFINSEPVKQEVAALPAHLPSDGEIAALKAKHGKIYQIEVEGEDGEGCLVFLFRKPDRKTLSATTKLSQSDPVAAAEVMLKNTLVFGDAKHFEDVSIFQALAGHFDIINKARVSTLKNL